MPLAPATKLGPYEILGPLGAGGMGEVWRARDTRLGREVALKVLPAAFAKDRERMVRFQREAQLLAAFNHQNIAAIYSFENVEGVQLLIMEMVPGETVKQLLAAGALSVSRALAIARQTAEALDAAHGKGILHRDLKPANVKVTPDGKVKLLDFGLAKAFGPGPKASDISESPTLDTGATLQGMVLGTAPYMSPEQARGRTLNWRSDVWSFGCLLFEMLSAKRAFGGASPSDILVAILEREPDWTVLPKETPPRILALLEECLTKDPDRRAPDMAHVRQQLDAALEGKTLYVPRSTSAVSERIRSAPRVWATAGALLAVAVAVLLYVSLRGKDTTALPASKLLAILPATDLTGREDGRQLCDGVSFSLGVKLQSVSGVAIMRPSTPAMLKETDPSKWARDTGANLLVQPAIRQMGDTRQLSFSVFLAGSPVQIAAGDATGPAAEHFRLEDELTQKLVAALRIHLASGSTARTPVPASVSAGAPQTDYVVALGYLERYDDKDSVQKAIDLLSKIPGADSSALIQAALGRAYLASYDLSKDVSRAEFAKTAAERAISLDPNLSEAQVTYGRVLLATGETEKGIEVIRKDLQIRPNDAESLRVLALALTKAGRLEEAEKTFLRVIELRPRAWSAYNGLGYLYSSSHRYQKAAEAFRRGIELNPDVARLHYNLGAALVQLDRFEEAEAASRRSIGLKETAAAWSNLGTAQYFLGHFEDAIVSFGKAVELRPAYYAEWINLGDAYRHTRDNASRAASAYARAIELGEKQLRLNPRDPTERVFLASAYAYAGHKDTAWEYVQTALAQARNDTDVLYRAALVANALERREDALRLLEEARHQGYGIAEMRREPDLSTLRNEPRFQTLIDPQK